MIQLPYGFQAQRNLIHNELLKIEKSLKQLTYEKGVLTEAFNSLNSDKDDILENQSFTNQETIKILKTKNI